MKLRPFSALGILILSGALGVAQESAPTGNISIDSGLIRYGATPLVNWAIKYPSAMEDLVAVGETGEIVIKRRSEVEIRVLGVALHTSSSLLPASLQAQIDGCWTTLFMGTSEQVNPSKVLYKQILEPDTILNLSARGGHASGEWSFSADTLTASSQVTHLREGDPVPLQVPARDHGTTEDYLSAFVGSNHTLTAGPRDLVYFFELSSTKASSCYFDMQDFAVMVTVKNVEGTEAAHRLTNSRLDHSHGRFDFESKRMPGGHP